MHASTTTTDEENFCPETSLTKGFSFQSSQPHLKRLVMFDYSDGKGRVFFHHALANELFGSMENAVSDGNASSQHIVHPLVSSESDIKAVTHRKIFEGAFASLQAHRSSRQVNLESLREGIQTDIIDVIQPLEESRVSEAIAMHQHQGRSSSSAIGRPSMASETLSLGTLSKVSTTLCPSKRLRVTLASSEIPPFGSRSCHQSQYSGAPPTPEIEGWENPEDLDALLSSDEDDEDEISSTGHSPDDFLEKEESYNEDENKISQQQLVGNEQCKHLLEPNFGCAGDERDVNRKRKLEYARESNVRKQKIKQTMKVLRRMIPGGASLDASIVLDHTIQHVKTLYDRINQLDARHTLTHH